MDFVSNDIKNEAVVKIRIDAVGGDLDRVACKYPQSFMDEMARQLTPVIEAACGVEGLADSSVELIMMFASATYMEHISGNLTYRRLMLIDAVSAPRDFWIKWTRLGEIDGEYNESNILFELGEDVDQKVREREYRYLLTAGKDKYHNSMGRKKVTEWREVIKRAVKRGELTRIENDFELSPETLELEERIADLLGKRIESRNQPVKEEIPFITPESDEFARALEKARAVVEEAEEIEYSELEIEGEEPDAEVETQNDPLTDSVGALPEGEPIAEETAEVEFDFFADSEADEETDEEELELEIEGELDIFKEEPEEAFPIEEEGPLAADEAVEIQNAECGMQNAELAFDEMPVEASIARPEAFPIEEGGPLAADEVVEIQNTECGMQNAELAFDEMPVEASIARPEAFPIEEGGPLAADEAVEIQNAECGMQNAELAFDEMPVEASIARPEAFPVVEEGPLAVDEAVEMQNPECGMQNAELAFDEMPVGASIARPEAFPIEEEGPLAADEAVEIQNAECGMQNVPLTDSVGALPKGEPMVADGASASRMQNDQPTTVYEPKSQQISIADRVADIRAELENKIRLEYEIKARIKAEEELAELRRQYERLRVESERLRAESEAAINEARAEQERLRLEYEHLLEMTEREASARAAQDARRRAEEAQLREQIEAQLRAEAAERERLAEAARMAIEEQHRLEAENARIAREREEEERIEAERQRRLEEERAIEEVRRAELERIRRENEEAKEKAKKAMPETGNGKYAYTSKSVKLVFRRSVDPNITARIQEIIKGAVDYYGKDNISLRIKASVPDSQTVILDFINIPIEEMSLLGNIIKILGNSGLGIAKAIVD